MNDIQLQIINKKMFLPSMIIMIILWTVPIIPVFWYSSSLCNDYDDFLIIGCWEQVRQPVMNHIINDKFHIFIDYGFRTDCGKDGVFIDKCMSLTMMRGLH